MSLFIRNTIEINEASLKSSWESFYFYAGFFRTCALQMNVGRNFFIILGLSNNKVKRINPPNPKYILVYS